MDHGQGQGQGQGQGRDFVTENNATCHDGFMDDEGWLPGRVEVRNSLTPRRRQGYILIWVAQGAVCASKVDESNTAV